MSLKKIYILFHLRRVILVVQNQTINNNKVLIAFLSLTFNNYNGELGLVMHSKEEINQNESLWLDA